LRLEVGQTLTPEIAQDICEYTRGTCKSEGEIAQAFDLTEDEVLSVLADAGIEVCEVCGWWVAEDELAESDFQIICLECAE